MSIKILCVCLLFTALLAMFTFIGKDSSRAISFNDAHIALSSASAMDLENTVHLPLMFRGNCAKFTASIIVIRPSDFPSSDQEGRIAHPKNCQIGLPAESSIPVIGDATNIPQGVYLWVFVYTANARYYPQCNNAIEGHCGVDFNGDTWSVTAYLGRAGIKEHFHLVLVETDNEGNEFLTEAMKRWAKLGFFPGFTTSEMSLYEIKELDSIQVETAGQ